MLFLRLFESKMQRFDGAKLSKLFEIKQQAPEFYYQALNGYFGTDLPDLLELIVALDKLGNE